MKVRMADLYGKTMLLSIQREELGAEFEDEKGRMFRYVKYNDGDDNIPGLRGHLVGLIGADAANVSSIYEVTANFDSSTVVTTAGFAGIIIPDVVLNGEYCWVQVAGMGLVNAWADAAQDRSTNELTNRCIPGAADGTVAVLTAGNEQQVCLEILADIDAVPTAAADRYLAPIPVGQTTTAQFAVGETVTANTDTAVVVEVLKRGAKDYGLIVSTVTSDYWAAAETAVGGTSAASGVLGDPAFAVFPQNYNIVYRR